MIMIPHFPFEYALMRFSILCGGLQPDCIERVNHNFFERKFFRSPQFWNFWNQSQTTTPGVTTLLFREN